MLAQASRRSQSSCDHHAIQEMFLSRSAWLIESHWSSWRLPGNEKSSASRSANQDARSGSSALSVNMPNVDLAVRAGAHTFVHIHRNTPGVLAAINAIFADHRVNIEGQALGTRGEVGYVITDVSSDFTRDAIDRLTHMDETIRLRVLGR